jgi:hypothetical protein
LQRLFFTQRGRRLSIFILIDKQLSTFWALCSYLDIILLAAILACFVRYKLSICPPFANHQVPAVQTVRRALADFDTSCGIKMKCGLATPAVI